MLVNEKNSMLSNARLWTKTLAVVYFRKGVMPMLLKEGMILSRLSRGVNRRSKDGRSQQHGCRSIHPRSIGKDING
mgnify:CR=1 FL=1